MGMQGFGASAFAEQLYKKFAFYNRLEYIAKKVMEKL